MHWPAVPRLVDGRAWSELFESAAAASFAKLAFLFAVEMQVEPEAFLEIPNCVDYAVGWADQFVTGCRDAEC